LKLKLISNNLATFVVLKCIVMKNTIKNILEKSGKKTTVSYKDKESRTSFDETFGKQKIEIASKLIGNNSVSLSQKLATK